MGGDDGGRACEEGLVAGLGGLAGERLGELDAAGRSCPLSTPPEGTPPPQATASKAAKSSAAA